jgi:alkanesulfonate monooxygenase SsuD/methylene tetrahydromethanopterin reductase-like flavin-dependent oxidoreductase (luciferase family)
VSAADELATTVELTALADEVGFDSVWLSEHHGATDAYLPSILPVLGAIAARTTHVQLGAATLLAPFHHPLRLAEDAAVVDQLSRGRLILGLGLGWRAEEFRAFGIDRRERLGRTTELISVLRQAWTGARFSFEGDYFRYSDVQVTPQPFHQTPIWFGATVPAAIRRAVPFADGFVASQLDVDEIRARFSIVREARGPRQLALGAILYSWLGPVTPAVLRGTWHAVDGYKAWRSGGDG